MHCDFGTLKRHCATSIGLAAMFVLPAWGQAGGTMEELRVQVEALRAEQVRVAEQQQQIDAKLRALEARLSVRATASEAAPANTLPAGGVDAQPRLSVSADLRLRYQGDYSDANLHGRSSGQVRGRFGATYAVTDRLTIGARMATGDPDDPNSTDAQLSNFDDDLDIALDLAYARIDFGNVNLYGGKIPQPFARTDLVWDSDVNPQGLGATYKRALADGSALRAGGLFFIVDEQAAADSTMAGGQVGYDSAARGDWKYDVSAAYYDYRLGSVAGADAGDFRSNLRTADGSYRSDFDLGDLLVGVTWSGAGARWAVRVVGDYVHNFGARTAADTGYGIDVAVGRAGRPHDWRVTYGYSVAETDSVLAAFSHDNIGIATNYRLHALTLDYVPWPDTLVSAIWYHYRQDQALDAGANDVNDWLDRVRIALLMSF